ncbi:hypothetical protein EBB07_20710 [Paenibacillaceae bacterium]|nr:hypothetical protein EBB07_20710 [Paenibacillaceae bacterium]
MLSQQDTQGNLLDTRMQEIAIPYCKEVDYYMTVKQKLEALKIREFSPDHYLLTVYLNTQPMRGQQAPWKIHLKNGVNRLQDYAKAAGALEQSQQLAKLHKQLDHHLETHRDDMRNGVIVVACPTHGILLFEKMQVPLPNSFYWADKPSLDELEAAVNQYPPAGIILVGGESITVIDASLGQVIREWNYLWDAEQEDWKQYQGLASGHREASSASHRERFDKRYEANRQRWLRRLTPILERHNKRNEWQEMILTGEANLTSELAKELNGRKPRVLSKNMNGMPSPQVLQEVYAAL